jgi:hypothetical protein
MNLWIPLGALAIYFIMNQKGTSMFNKQQLDKIKAYGKAKGNLDFKDWTIVGIRGAKENSGNVDPIPNIRNQFNDLLILIKNDKSIVLSANLEPGTPSMSKPINPEGTFQINDGFYKVGKTTHGRDVIIEGKKTRIREKAFNIINPQGQRDKNKDGKFDSQDPVHALNPAFGINIHPTNRRNPKTVDGSSYGCVNPQAFWEDDIWEEFRDTLYNDNNQTWNLMIVDSKKII